jgi:hypothetical protein
MGAFAGQSQKAAVFQPCQIKSTADEGSDRIRYELVEGTAGDDGIGSFTMRFRFVRPQKSECNGDKLNQGNEPQGKPEFGQKAATRGTCRWGFLFVSG